MVMFVEAEDCKVVIGDAAFRSGLTQADPDTVASMPGLGAVEEVSEAITAPGV